MSVGAMIGRGRCRCGAIPERHCTLSAVALLDQNTTPSSLKHSRLGGKSSLAVGDLDAQCLCLCNNFDSLPGRHGVCDFGSICSVVHEEEFDISCVVDKECLVARWHHVSGLLVRAETDRRHNHLSLEPSSNSV